MKGKNLFWGLLLILVAGLLIADQMGYLVGINTFKLAISVLLAPVIVISVVKTNFFGIFFPAAVLGIMYAEQLGITDFVPWPILLVALLLSIGLSLIFGKNYTYFGNWKEFKGFDSEEIVDSEDDESVQHSTTFGSSIKYVNSKNLKRARLAATFGDLTVYFDNTTVSPEGALIQVNVTFSDVQIYIPKNWRIQNEIGSILSDIGEKRTNTEAETATVRLVGNATFSDIRIIYV